MGAKSDKLMESYGQSNSDKLRIWIIKFLEDMSSGGAGLATEATLQSVLAAIQDGQDYEAKIVVDDNGDGDTYLEVRIWNPDTQTWETPLYYAAGSNTGVPIGSLTAPVIYINPNQLLAQILSILGAQSNLANGIARATSGGSTAAGHRRISIMNTGNANGLVGGVTIRPGESFTWSADGFRDTLAAITYDGTGTELVITTVG